MLKGYLSIELGYVKRISIKFQSILKVHLLCNIDKNGIRELASLVEKGVSWFCTQALKR